MSDQTKQPLSAEQRAIFESIPLLPNPVYSFGDRMDLAQKLNRLAEWEATFPGKAPAEVCALLPKK